MPSGADPLEPLLRELAPQVLGAVVRRYGDFGLCEDAVQEALLAAAAQWPADGRPGNPRSWLITAASRRRIELWRSDMARRRREDAVAAQAMLDPAPVPTVDDTLTLLFLCCHPSLAAASQVALTLRAVGGLTTAEISRAFLVPDATIGQRISRAKQRIRADGARFVLPPTLERADRLAAVLRILYLIFNEGYTATSGGDLVRPDLSTEAIRLARQLHERLPDDGEVTGLLALMLFTDARRPARTAVDGSLVPLDRQDRTLWDHGAVAEADALLTAALRAAPLGPYQVQAAIAGVHSEAADVASTDWAEILGLYDVLARLAPGPVVALNRLVALAMVEGPAAALDQLAGLALPSHRVDAVRAHLLEQAGDLAAAREVYRAAAVSAGSDPERRYLIARAAEL
ncbi:MAG: RNA polymerase sigma factor [Jatrophihabitans sp.]